MEAKNEHHENVDHPNNGPPEEPSTEDAIVNDDTPKIRVKGKKVVKKEAVNAESTDILQDIVDEAIVNASEDPAKSFRLQCQRIFLTYSAMNKSIEKGWLDKKIGKEELKEFLNKKLPNKAFPLKVIYIAQETHRDKDIHFHVVMDLKRRMDTRNCRFFDYDSWHPNISKVLSPVNWGRVCYYISKADVETREEIPKNILLAHQVWSSPSIGEAMMNSHARPMDVKMLWEARPSSIKKKHISMDKPRPWQAEALKHLGLDDRKIHVFVGHDGHEGKSTLCKYLRQEKLAWVCKRVGKTDDFTRNIQNALSGGWNGAAVLFDLPRSAETLRSLYECIEELKDGFMTATKYNGGDVDVCDGCCVVLFLNWWPELHLQSRDRWELYEIVDPLEEPVKRSIAFVNEKHRLDKLEARKQKIRERIEDEYLEREARKEVEEEMIAAGKIPKPSGAGKGAYHDDIEEI